MTGGLPADGGIPALKLAALTGLAAVLRRMDVEPAEGEVEVLGYHAGSRCTFSGARHGERVVVKAFASDPDRIVSLFHALASAGLASGDAPTAPPLLGHDPVLGVVVNGVLSGPTAWELIERGEGARAGALAAAWLTVAADAVVPLAADYDPVTLLRDAGRWVRRLGEADPRLQDAGRAALAGLAADVPDGRPLRLVHGSFSPSHVLDLGSGPGVIDWDNAAQGPAEYDVGLFLASLRRGRGGREGLLPDSAAAGEALLRDIGDLVDAQTVAWYEAACLVKLAKYLASRRPERWNERAEKLLAAAIETAGRATPLAAQR